MDALYGIHAVEEALRARSRSLDHVEVARERHDQRLQALIDLARQEGVSLRFVPREQLDRLARTKSHQGVVAGYDGNDSLVRLGSRKAVKLFTRNKAQRNALLARQIDQCLQPLIVPLSSDFHVIQRAAACAQRLFHRMDSVESIHRRQCTSPGCSDSATHPATPLRCLRASGRLGRYAGWDVHSSE